MIEISKYIHPDVIIPKLSADCKEEAIGKLIEKLFENNSSRHYKLDKESALREVLEREKLQPTGIGSGLAFPHARIEGWGKFALALGICHEGVDFNSPDKISAKIICLVISSTEEPYMILQVMSAIIRFLNNNNLMDTLCRPSLTAMDISNLFRDKPILAQDQILAGDIARPVKTIINTDMSIEEATRVMHLNHIDILPVVDNDKKFCGEISCLEVFRYGLPDFFKQLHTVSFVKHIDPFEKYFRIKRNLKVKDLYIRESKPLYRDNTLVEIIFEMTVKQKSRLFVVNDDRTLAGLIDRFTIIDKILFT
jgi:nitrogen PTS system EIIA component